MTWPYNAHVSLTVDSIVVKTTEQRFRLTTLRRHFQSPLQHARPTKYRLTYNTWNSNYIWH